MKNNIITLLKGLVIGSTMLVPGVSGGAMAMTLGIYKKLVSAISTIRQRRKENLTFLALFILGAAIGMLLIANPILSLINLYPKPTLFFFLGAVAGAVPMIIKESKVTKVSFKSIVCVVLGAAIVFLLSLLPSDLFLSDSSEVFLRIPLLIAAGFVSAFALILPGVSVSYFLLLLGLYDQTMLAISTLDITFLAPLVFGLAIGILLATKMLDRALTRYPHTAYLIIFGFVIGSIIQAFPGLPIGWEFPLCVLTAAVGFNLIMLLHRFSPKQ